MIFTCVWAMFDEFFGHDAVVLHEREIRKEMPPFDFLMADRGLRDRFLAAIEALIRDIDMTCYVQVINKVEHRAKYSTPWNPYEIAMHFGLEKIWSHMRAKGQQGHKVHVIFESRGRNEDRDLELEFRRVVTNQSHFGWRRLDFTICEFEPVFVPKAANLAGHQIADLIARPLALKALRPLQPNRATDVLAPKIGYFKTFP